MDAVLGDGTINWVLLRAGRVTGRGRVAPRLTFEIYFRTPRERVQAQVQLMCAQLVARNEILGDGVLTGIEAIHGEYSSSIEIPLSRPTLDFLSTLVNGEKVDLALRLSGWMRVKDDNEDQPRYASSPSPGQWIYVGFGFGRQTDLPFQIARSDWFSEVIQPIGTSEYISLEISIPTNDQSLRAAAKRLAEAEKAYVEGDDPTVFARCRAATEALPGAPKQIFSDLSDPDEAILLDELMVRANGYFHRGRHVAKEGDQRGEFPVTHADARFALSLAKLLVGHSAHVLSRTSP